MNIAICSQKGWLLPLARHLELEGHDVTIIAKPELVGPRDDLLLTDTTVDPSNRRVPTIGGGDTLHGELLRPYNLVPGPSRGDHIVVKWFDRSQGFHPQLLLGFPVSKFMVGDLGTCVQAGMGARYMSECDLLQDLFMGNVALKATLEAMGFSGPVIIERDSRTKGVVSIHMGLRSIVLYNMFEGLPCSIVEWLDDPLSKTLYQSWTVNILVSRYPYPFQLEDGNVPLTGLTRSAEKHFWTFGGTEFKRSVSTHQTRLGLATGWGQTLSDAGRTSLSLARSVDVPDVQYRTDVPLVVGDRWHDVQGSLS